MTFAIHPGSVRQAIEDALVRLEKAGFVEALWTRRLDLWSSDPAIQHSIGNRLGWLNATEQVRSDLPRLPEVARSIVRDGITDVVLLGMGGSSLAADVLRSVCHCAPGYARFQVLDSVDPDAVRAVMARADTSLFIVASKSGSTVEVSSLAAEAEARVRSAGVASPGSRFIAITDPDSTLQHQALARRYRDIFLNPADIGGRYSALSLFGLGPAALMGADLASLTSAGAAMADACRSTDVRSNPGTVLGATMAAAAMMGRDKLTIVLPDRIERLGLWIEQLVAESTGKSSRGIVPIVERAGAERRGADRLLVEYAAATGDLPTIPEIEPAEAYVSIAAPPETIGGEFFRWEFATAVAGFLLGVNPFDEPNVREAKDATRALLAVHRAEGRLPVPEPDAFSDGVALTLSEAARKGVGDRGPLAILTLLEPGDYFAALSYLPPEREPFHGLLQQLCTAAGELSGCATSLGYGPRYLHSTGQLHKGGPNSGVFLLLTAEPASDLPIPGESYSFGVLELAQAVGDYASLDQRGRRVLRVHLPSRDPALLQQLSGRLLAHR